MVLLGPYTRKYHAECMINHLNNNSSKPGIRSCKKEIIEKHGVFWLYIDMNEYDPWKYLED